MWVNGKYLFITPHIMFDVILSYKFLNICIAHILLNVVSYHSQQRRELNDVQQNASAPIMSITKYI